MTNQKMLKMKQLMKKSMQMTLVQKAKTATHQVRNIKTPSIVRVSEKKSRRTDNFSKRASR